MAFSNATTLGDAIRRVRIEAGQSPNPAHGANDREAIVHLLNRVQTQLAANYDWPRRGQSAVLTLTPDVYEYPVPSPFQFENIERVVVDYGSSVVQLSYGIRAEHTAYLSNTDPNDTRTPVRRWEFAGVTNNKDQIKFWPTPDTAQTVTIEGDGQPVRLESDADILAFNGDMAALYVAAELLASQSDAMAASKRQMADELRRALHHRQRERQGGKFYLGQQELDQGRGTSAAPRYGIDYIEW